MGFADYILIGAIVLIVGLAAFYVIRAKKKGVDLTTKAPFEAAMQEFADTLNEFKSLL